MLLFFNKKQLKILRLNQLQFYKKKLLRNDFSYEIQQLTLILHFPRQCKGNALIN